MTIAQLGIEHLSLFGSTARGGAREESDIDLFFDYKRQKGKVGLFDLVDVKEPSRSSLTMTRASLTIYRETSPPRSAASAPRTPCHPEPLRRYLVRPVSRIAIRLILHVLAEKYQTRIGSSRLWRVNP